MAIKENLFKEVTRLAEEARIRDRVTARATIVDLLRFAQRHVLGINTFLARNRSNPHISRAMRELNINLAETQAVVEQVDNTHLNAVAQSYYVGETILTPEDLEAIAQMIQDTASEFAATNGLSHHHIQVVLHDTETNMASTLNRYIDLDDIEAWYIAWFNEMLLNYDSMTSDQLIGMDTAMRVFKFDRIIMRGLPQAVMHGLKKAKMEFDENWVIIDNSSKSNCLFYCQYYWNYWINNRRVFLGAKQVLKDGAKYLRSIECETDADDILKKYALKTNALITVYSVAYEVWKTIDCRVDGVGPELYAIHRVGHIHPIFKRDTVNREDMDVIMRDFVNITEEHRKNLEATRDAEAAAMGMQLFTNTLSDISEITPDERVLDNGTFKEELLRLRKSANFSDRPIQTLIVTLDLETMPLTLSEYYEKYPHFKRASVFKVLEPVYKSEAIKQMVQRIENRPDHVEHAYCSAVTWCDQPVTETPEKYKYSKLVRDKRDGTKYFMGASEALVPAIKFRGGGDYDTFRSCVYNKPELKSHVVFDFTTAIDDMLTFMSEQFKNSERWVYMHNGGKFDLVIMFNHIVCHPLYKIDNVQILHDRIINMDVHTTTGASFHFRDSYCLLSHGLSALCKSFSLPEDEAKLNFNIGQHRTPDTILAARDEIMEYNKQDTTALFHILGLFDNQIRSLVPQLSIVNAVTASSLAKKMLFGTGFFCPSNVMSLSSRQEEFMKGCYHGGRTEAFYIGKISGPVYYYDLVSSYPAVGSYLKLPVGKAYYVRMFSGVLQRENTIYINQQIHCGIFKVRVRTIDTTLLPMIAHEYNHKLVFPIFKNWTETTLTWIEIAKGVLTGQYEFQLLDGYVWFNPDKENDGRPLRTVFLNMYKLKEEARDDVMRYTSKLLLNSIYGVFAFNRFSKDKVYIGTDHNAHVNYLLDPSNRLVTHSVAGRYNVCLVNADAESAQCNVAIAAHITAAGRLVLWDIMNYVRSSGGKLYYCDTDSVMCSIPLEGVNFGSTRTGRQLGNLKNELGPDNFMSHGYILGPKSYAFKYGDSKIKVAMKGLKGYKNEDDAEVWSIVERLYRGDIISSSTYSFSSTALRTIESGTVKYTEAKKSTPFKMEWWKSYTKGISVPIVERELYVNQPFEL